MSGAAPLVEAVVFDIGGVLLAYDFDRAVRAAAPLAGLPVAEVRQRLFGDNGYASMGRDREVAKFECGLISEREFHACVEALLQRRLPFELFRDAWNGIFIHEIEPTVTLMRQLRRRPGLKVGMLSNTNALHYAYVRQRWSMFSEIEHVYVSHEIGRRKPDPEAYRHVLENMGVPARRTVFVDDLIENVIAARAVGMLAIHAPDAAAVRTGLAALGLV
ncbi:MAG: HAD family phosphatase [Planctomycetota bacterium]|nr:HAD family phosphatase [Planctomycetota bacterium]